MDRDQLWGLLLSGQKRQHERGLVGLEQDPEAMERFMLDGDRFRAVPPGLKVSAAEVAAWLPEVEADEALETPALAWYDGPGYVHWMQLHAGGHLTVMSTVRLDREGAMRLMRPGAIRGERGAWARHGGKLSGVSRSRAGVVLYRFEGVDRVHILSLINGHRAVYDLHWRSAREEAGSLLEG